MGQKSGHSTTGFSAQHLLRLNSGVCSWTESLPTVSGEGDVLRMVRSQAESLLMVGSLRFLFPPWLSAGDCYQHLSAPCGPHHMVPSLLKANSGESP